MKTTDLKEIMYRGGFESAKVTQFPSSCHGGSPESETIIEQFYANAPDGSQFLVSITKIREEEPSRYRPINRGIK